MMNKKTRIMSLRNLDNEAVIISVDRKEFKAKLFEVAQSVLIERMRDATDSKESRLLNLTMVKLHDNSNDLGELLDILHDEGFTYDVKRVDI